MCQRVRIDLDWTKHLETWFVDCKHYQRGVPPEALQGLLAWSEAERPHTALIIASGFLSNPAKDYLEQYRETRRPPFKIKYWERSTLEKLSRDKLGRDLLLEFHLLPSRIRDVKEILAVEEELAAKLWYSRHLIVKEKVMHGDLKIVRGGLARNREIDPQVWKDILALEEQILQQYGKEQLGPYSDFEWGMIAGKLSALRWVLGKQWDELYTQLDVEHE